MNLTAISLMVLISALLPGASSLVPDYRSALCFSKQRDPHDPSECDPDQPRLCCFDTPRNECFQSPGPEWCGCMSGYCMPDEHHHNDNNNALTFYRRGNGQSPVDREVCTVNRPSSGSTCKKIEEDFHDCSVRVSRIVEAEAPNNRPQWTSASTTSSPLRQRVDEPYEPPTECWYPNYANYRACGLRADARHVPLERWVTYATNQGYGVLNLDNLGAGDSQKANPITEVQQPLQTAIIHKITQMLRAGQLTFAPKASKVIFVGHSLASVIGNGIATHYPSDFDAMILTGWSDTLVQAGLGLLLTVVEPAQVQNPAKFGTFPPGYLAFSSRQGKRDAYYGDDGAFSQGLADWDFDHEDTITIGQIYSAFGGLERAEGFTGDVFALTGQQDAFFCGPTGSRALGPQSCGTGSTSIPAKSKAFFPNANYDYYLPPNTSHATTLHYSTPESMRRAHRFLAMNGY